MVVILIQGSKKTAAMLVEKYLAIGHVIEKPSFELVSFERLFFRHVDLRFATRTSRKVLM